MNKLFLLIGFLMISAFISRDLLFPDPFPKHFPTRLYDLNQNPLTPKKIQLGRALFYDSRFSSDNSISCASCHSPYNAFAHTDHALSHGIHDSVGTRNAPALFNLAWHKEMMWDGAIHHLDFQALAPIQHPGEMNETLENILFKLKEDKKYLVLFDEVFGSPEISTERILKALSAFLLNLISANSKYDRVIQRQDSFNEQQRKGYSIYKKHCSGCHTEPLFSDFSFKKNGLPLDTILLDIGRMKISLQQEDSMAFKVPSLRNLSYTYPYMHDGRFNTLREVVSHYSDSLNQYSWISAELDHPIQLNDRQKTDLIAFLLCLNDSSFVHNTIHQYPRNFLLKNP